MASSAAAAVAPGDSSSAIPPAVREFMRNTAAEIATLREQADKTNATIRRMTDDRVAEIMKQFSAGFTRGKESSAQQLATAAADAARLTSDLKELQTQHDSIVKEHNELKNLMEEKEKTHDAALTAAILEKNDAAQKLKACKRELETFKKAAERHNGLQSTKVNLEEDKAKLEKDNVDLERKLTDLESKLKYYAKLKATEGKNEIQRLNDLLAAKERMVTQLLCIKEDTESQLATANSKRDYLRARLQDVKGELATVQSAQEALQERNQALSSNLASERSISDSLRTHNVELRRELEPAIEARDEMQAKNNNLHSELRELRVAHANLLAQLQVATSSY